MKEDNKDYYSLGDIVKSIRSFVQYLCKRWWMLIVAVFVCAGLGAVYYYIQKPKYEAVTTFILEEKSSGGGGGLAGLASQFGLSLGSLGSGGSIFSGDNILNILKSKKIVQQVLLSKVDETKSDEKTLADLYLDFTGIRKGWKNNPGLAGMSFGGVKKQITPVQDSILNVMYETIVKKNLFTERSSKQGTIIKVQVTAADCAFARLMTMRLVEEASKLYMDIRIGNAQDNIRQLQRRSDSLLMLLNNKSFSAAAIQQLDINPGIRTAAVPVEIASRDKTVLATLYAEVTKNLEASKLLLSQQTPVIELLDQPGYLLSDNKKGLLFLLVVASMIGGFLFVVGAFLYFLFLQQNVQKDSNDKKD